MPQTNDDIAGTFHNPELEMWTDGSNFAEEPMSLFPLGIIMPTIQRTLHIQADPEAVFDLVSRVEDFSQYSKTIQKIISVKPDTYRWHIRAAGFELEWDSIVTAARRPSHLAWRSIHGVDNRGAFDLAPVAGGTRVCFTMTYQLANPILEKIINAIAAPIMRQVAGEILEQVRQRLEKATQ